MSLKKQYNETTPECKVTFVLAKDIVSPAERVFLAGDFNEWDVESIPMFKQKSGEYSVSINLRKEEEYEFKYFIDGMGWINEKDADKQVPNEFQSVNSVVII